MRVSENFNHSQVAKQSDNKSHCPSPSQGSPKMNDAFFMPTIETDFPLKIKKTEKRHKNENGNEKYKKFEQFEFYWRN